MDWLADMKAIERISRSCVHKFPGTADIGDWREAFNVARSAVLEKVAEAIAAGDDATGDDLYRAGYKALSRNVAEKKRRLKMYLIPPAMDSAEERTIERLALAEVLGMLPSKDQEVILTFAYYDRDTRAAAAYMGVSREYFVELLRRARLRFFDAWFDWEQPPALPMVRKFKLSSHCGKGHEFTSENTGYHRGANSTVRNVRFCLTCAGENALRRREREKDLIA